MVFIDTIIYGTNEEFFLTLQKILSKFVEFNVRLNSSKYCFFMNQIKFLGHILVNRGWNRAMRGSNVSGPFQSPLLSRPYKGFICMVNYFRYFINGLSGHLITLTVPMIRLNKILSDHKRCQDCVQNVSKAW